MPLFTLASPLDVFQLSLCGQGLSDLLICSYALCRFLHRAFQLKPTRVKFSFFTYVMLWHGISLLVSLCLHICFLVAIPIPPTSLTFWAGAPSLALGFSRGPPLCQ